MIFKYAFIPELERLNHRLAAQSAQLQRQREQEEAKVKEGCKNTQSSIEIAAEKYSTI
jgi:hypothetical protein